MVKCKLGRTFYYAAAGEAEHLGGRKKGGSSRLAEQGRRTTASRAGQAWRQATPDWSEGWNTSWNRLFLECSMPLPAPAILLKWPGGSWGAEPLWAEI
jgi:hypothetical protein